MAKLVEVNPNPKIGIAFDTHAPQEFNVTLFDDKSGVAYKRQTDNFDMRTYANEILECLFAREERRVRQDWQNKLIKWVKQGSKQHHVHVLLRDNHGCLLLDKVLHHIIELAFKSGQPLSCLSERL